MFFEKAKNSLDIFCYVLKWVYGKNKRNWFKNQRYYIFI